MVDYTLPILKAGCDIIETRGWTDKGHAATGPVCIRTAMKIAAEHLVPQDTSWYFPYLDAMHLLTLELKGVQFWEYGVALRNGGRRPRTQEEVLDKLSKIIERVEHHEAQTGHGKRPGRSGADRRTF